MENAHQIRETSRHSLVTILNQESMLRRVQTLKKPVKAAHNLGKGLLKWRCPGWLSSETSLVRTLCEKTAVIPSSNGFHNLPQHFTPLGEAQMDVGVCLPEILPIFLNRRWAMECRLSHQKFVSGPSNRFSPLGHAEHLEVASPLLF
jgi:hypothetical protein